MNLDRLPVIPLDYIPRWEKLQEIMYQLAEAAPELVRLRSIGKSREGRDLLLLVITNFSTGCPEDRPALFLMGEIHAAELNMSILHFARKLIVESAADDLLSRRTFYLLPRVNPDGAEFVLKYSAGCIRSGVPEADGIPNRLYPADVDGDGRILTMLIPSPTGTQVKDPLDPRLLIPRTPDSEGPFYHVVPEGLIQDWDGTDLFDVVRTFEDWNRNWPSGWVPRPEHGRLPLSAPETRAVADFMATAANIFCAVSLHVGGKAVLLPPARQDAVVEPLDQAVLMSLAQTAKECLNVDSYINCEYNLPPFRWVWPFYDRPGAFQDFCYQYLGIPNCDLEIGGGVHGSCGVQNSDWEKLRNWDDFHALNRRMMTWYDQQPDSPELCVPWRKFRHPQLGEVEIGGMISLVFNSTHISQRRDETEALCCFYRKLAGYAPELTWIELAADSLGNGLWRIRATAANRGAFSTHLTRKAVQNARFPESYMKLHCADGVELVSRERIRKFGELPGFSGRCSGEWFIRAPENISELGTVSIRCGAAGKIEAAIRKHFSSVVEREASASRMSAAAGQENITSQTNRL